MLVQRVMVLKGQVRKVLLVDADETPLLRGGALNEHTGKTEERNINRRRHTMANVQHPQPCKIAGDVEYD